MNGIEFTEIICNKTLDNNGNLTDVELQVINNGIPYSETYSLYNKILKIRVTETSKSYVTIEESTPYLTFHITASFLGNVVVNGNLYPVDLKFERIKFDDKTKWGVFAFIGDGDIRITKSYLNNSLNIESNEIDVYLSYLTAHSSFYIYANIISV